MPVPTKPTDNTNFATDPAAPKTQPSATLQTDGYSQDDIPTHENFNWVFNNFYLWENYLETLTDFLLTFIVFNETNDILQIGNFDTNYSKVEYRNDRGTMLIQTKDLDVTDTATNQSDIYRNKTVGKTFSRGATTDMGDNGIRAPFQEFIALRDGFDLAVDEKVEIINNSGQSQPAIDAVEAQLSRYVSGAINRTQYNDNIVLFGFPTDLTNQLLLVENTDEAYFSCTMGINALKISSDRSDGADSVNGARYGTDAFIGVNASYSGTDTSPFIQDIKCDGRDPVTSLMCGMMFLPNGNGVQVVTQTSGVSHGTALVAGTNYTSGPYVQPGGTSWTNGSDERLKDVVGDIGRESLSLIEKIDCKIAVYKSDEDKKEIPVFIAQNMQEVMPNIVSSTENDDDMLGIQYDNMIPVNTAGIKELIKENERLNNRLDELEERLLNLENV